MNVSSLSNSADVAHAFRDGVILPSTGESRASRIASDEAQASSLQRSRWLGRSLAYRIASDLGDRDSSPRDVLPLGLSGNPSTGAPRDPSIENSLTELLRAVERTVVSGLEPANESASDAVSNQSLSSNQRIRELKACLPWAHDQMRDWDPTLRESCLLKILLPYYMATPRREDGARTTLNDVFEHGSWLMLELVSVLELHRCLQPSGFAEWINEPKRMPLDPRQAIAESFRISLPDVVVALCERLEQSHATYCPGALDLASLSRATLGARGGYATQETRPSDALHQQWWSMAWQVCSSQSLPMSTSRSNSQGMEWNQFLEHWSRLYDSLQLPAADAESAVREPDDVPSPRRPALDPRIVEVHSPKETVFVRSLDVLLHACRVDQGALALVIVRWVDEPVEVGSGKGTRDDGEIPYWPSDLLDAMDATMEANCVHGFRTDSGDVALIYRDVDRGEIAQGVRDGFAKLRKTMFDPRGMASQAPIPWIAGIALVSGPSRSFQSDQLVDAAWRCLESANVQGTASIKSIEVF